ncbi:MAG: tripartite tricarboxylate transporter permease [Candidatus Micrarchaeia archaeon]
MLQVLAVAAGILLGILSGLLPGIHSNTIASVLSTLPLAPEFFTYIIVAVLGAHIVFSFFPSVFLSIPDDTVVASVLPGHRMALAGRGREAITVCAMAVILASCASALLLPVSIALLPIAYAAISPHMALVLAAASVFLLASEREGGKIAIAAAIFLLAGALGVATMRGGIVDPLFPAFSGLFAGSGILLSFTSARGIPKQKEGKTELDFLPYVAAGVVLGALSDLLPGIAAPAQIAIFASVFIVANDARKFLALVASIAASHAVFAFAALVSIGKAREGSLAIMEAIKSVGAGDLPALVGVLLLSIGVSAFLLMKLSVHADRLQKIGMRNLNLGILAYLVCAIAIISGAEGLLVFATATAVGLLPPLLGVRRTHVMGLIIVPSMLLSL